MAIIFSTIRMITLATVLMMVSASCKKYLDKKPLKERVEPSTVEDFQSLLDEHIAMNQAGTSLPEIVADNYYLTSADWQTRAVNERLNYIWDKNAVHSSSWSVTYQKAIYISNIVLDGLKNIEVSASITNAYNNAKGSALFYRAFQFYELAQLYCKPYSSEASKDPGIVLRLSSDINEVSQRYTVHRTYDQIIGDLKQSIDLLPETPLVLTRPSKVAAYGLLARTYLSMRDYVNAGTYADLCLQKYSTLIDYNSLLPLANPPIQRFNKETIFYSTPGLFSTLGRTRAKIDTTLYRSYQDNDLRKTVFFIQNANGSQGFRGSYDGTSADAIPFNGITTDETYLIRAESRARAGDMANALNDLNTLMKMRWKKNEFTDITATNANDALQKILVERRKELVYRCTRWADLRRLNLEGANITLKRVINNNVYTLPPGDPRWVMLIPPEVMAAVSLPQNPR